jgi:hypothetical protein
MMSKIKHIAKVGVKQLTADEFFVKHQSELAEDDSLKVEPPPQLSKMTSSPIWMPLDPEVSAYFAALTNTNESRLRSKFGSWWRVRLLAAAKKENSPEAYRELLEGLLISLGLEPPDGVLVPRRRPRGAPRKQSTEQTYRTWILNGQPRWSELAYIVFGRDYIGADANQRKNLRDRCEKAVKRQKRIATKLPRN